MADLRDPTLDLFNGPDIRTEPPVAPGSESSREAAESITDPMRARCHRLIMLELAAATVPLSREMLSYATGIKETTLCARLAELRPFYVASIDRACVAKSGLRVDGYALTDVGRRRVRGAA